MLLKHFHFSETICMSSSFLCYFCLLFECTSYFVLLFSQLLMTIFLPVALYVASKTVECLPVRLHHLFSTFKPIFFVIFVPSDFIFFLWSQWVMD